MLCLPEKKVSCSAEQGPDENFTSQPFQRVVADILELPLTSTGNRYVLVVQDYFIKVVNLYAIVFKDYILHHGVMETLHTDQGRQFRSDVVRQLCDKLGVKKTRTTPYNLKSDGMVERFNWTFIDQLAKMLLSCEVGFVAATNCVRFQHECPLKY